MRDHSRREQDSVASRVLVVLCLAVVGLVGIYQHRMSLRAGLKESQDLETELYALRQRQQIIDRELLALGVMLSRKNESWRQEALHSLRGKVLVEEIATRKEVTKAPRAIVNSALEIKHAPWGAGPPPDAYFLDWPQCGKSNFPASFHVYERGPERACTRAAMGWRFEPECPSANGRAMTNKRLRRQILITGVQRSGSHFTWEMFNRLGVHIHHEGLGPAGSASWLYSWRAKSFVINNPSPLTPDHRFCIILHQVRHPLRVLSSIVKATKPNDKFWNWIYTVEPTIDRSAPALLRAAQLWLNQNLRIEQYADARYRAEETSPRDVCKAAGFPDFICLSDGRYHTTTSKVIQPIIEPRKLPLGPNDGPPLVSNYRPPSVSWDDLNKLDPSLTARIQDLTTRYGYNIDPRFHPQGLDTSAFKA